MTLLNERKLAHSTLVEGLLRVEASAYDSLARGGLTTLNQNSYEAPQSLLTARDGALESGGFKQKDSLNERKPSTLNPSRELLRVAASAWLHSNPEAVSEAPQSLPPFTARNGALKSGGFSRMTLLKREEA